MKWLSHEDERKLGFVQEEDKEADKAGPSSPKADKVRAEAKEETAAETSAKVKGKVPEVEEEVLATTELVLDEADPNAEVESERRQSLPKTLTDKPRARKKTKMTKKLYNTIKLSDEELQEAKREEETILAEDTSQVPEVDMIEKFRMSMVYGEQVVVSILRILEESRAQVDEESRQRMTLTGIALHLSKENRIEEKQQLRTEA
ncbi:hypothetical protein R1flu_017685 [Riccia fluitans]|uniref:Uncharacterized protein n=1 Tax=Riccia fluitans TaxID=41844 RepID=A0ABD1ZDW1_9MARC